MSITVISEKTILESDLFTVQEITLELGNGVKKVYKNIRRDPAVSIFPITSDYTLYLINQYRYLYKKKLIEAISGMVDHNESFLEAAKRELKEEAGLKALQWEELGSMEAAASIATWTQKLFLARDITEEIASPQDDEEIEVIKMPLEQAVEMVTSGKIQTASSMIGILLLDRMRKEGKI